MSESTSPHASCTVLNSTQVIELRPAQLMSRNRTEIYSFVAQALNMALQEGAYGVVFVGVLAENAVHDMLGFRFLDPGAINTDLRLQVAFPSFCGRIRLFSSLELSIGITRRFRFTACWN